MGGVQVLLVWGESHRVNWTEGTVRKGTSQTHTERRFLILEMRQFQLDAGPPDYPPRSLLIDFPAMDRVGAGREEPLVLALGAHPVNMGNFFRDEEVF